MTSHGSEQKEFSEAEAEAGKSKERETTVGQQVGWIDEDEFERE